MGCGQVELVRTCSSAAHLSTLVPVENPHNKQGLADFPRYHQFFQRALAAGALCPVGVCAQNHNQEPVGGEWPGWAAWIQY